MSRFEIINEIHALVTKIENEPSNTAKLLIESKELNPLYIQLGKMVVLEEEFYE